MEWVDSNPNASMAMKKEIKKVLNDANKNNPDLGLGFDPILDAQDSPAEFVIDSMDQESGYVIVRGKDWDSFRLMMRLKVENGIWYVDGSGIINIPKDKRIKR